MFVYLASPYTHKDEKIMKQRYEDMLFVVNICLQMDLPCYSPIVHWHPASLRHRTNLGRPAEFHHFLVQDLSLVAACYELWAIALDGWEKSKGVAEELDFARDMGKTTRIVALKDVENTCIYTRKGLVTRMSSLSEKLLEKMKSAKGYPSSVTPVSS